MFRGQVVHGIGWAGWKSLAVGNPTCGTALHGQPLPSRSVRRLDRVRRRKDDLRPGRPRVVQELVHPRHQRRHPPRRQRIPVPVPHVHHHHADLRPVDLDRRHLSPVLLVARLQRQRDRRSLALPNITATTVPADATSQRRTLRFIATSAAPTGVIAFDPWRQPVMLPRPAGIWQPRRRLRPQHDGTALGPSGRKIDKELSMLPNGGKGMEGRGMK